MLDFSLQKRFKNMYFWDLLSVIFAAFAGNFIQKRLFRGSGVILSAFITCCFVFLPNNAWALQSHGAPEGLYVHQMAHIHFIFALGYLYWDIQRSSFSGKGWHHLLTFCVLMLCWNIVAFVGHAVSSTIDADIISTANGYLWGVIKGPYDLPKLLYYFAKFDHLLAVPALFFFYMGMRSLYHSVEQHGGEAGG